MCATFFKPSIHGWPFDNSFHYQFSYLSHDFVWGFCGGMCWKALSKFFQATPIPRDTQPPNQGEALYNEIWDAQKRSVTIGTLAKIYDWMQKTDVQHPVRADCLGDETKGQWKELKPILDEGKPVTLTLIRVSNCNPVSAFAHFTSNHRVVAYDYRIRTGAELSENCPEGSTEAVDLKIYDPNYPNDDNVQLTFYLGKNHGNIKIHYNKPNEEVHGFFIDDQSGRAFTHPQNTAIKIESYNRVAYSSSTTVDYQLKFSWKCSFIPYFIIQVNDENWKNNNTLKQNLQPKDLDNKQCASAVGDTTLTIQLPRDICKLTVRLLDSDNFTQSVKIDEKPEVFCYPYLHTRRTNGPPCICEDNFREGDLFIKERKPNEEDVQQLDTSTFRWIISTATATAGNPDPLKRMVIDVLDQKWLGNVTIPVLASFIEKNLVLPTTTTGKITTFKGSPPNLTVSTQDLSALSKQDQKIFDGFPDKSLDYDGNTHAIFTYRTEDSTHAVVNGTIEFFGKSIILKRTCTATYILDPSRIARMEQAAHKLAEMGLIDLAIELPERPELPEIQHTQIVYPPPDARDIPEVIIDLPTIPVDIPGTPGPHGPAPGRGTPHYLPKLSSINRQKILKKITAQPQVQTEISNALKTTGNNKKVWLEIQKAQTKMLQIEKLGTIKRNQINEQTMYDSVISHLLAYNALTLLAKNTEFLKLIKKL